MGWICACGAENPNERELCKCGYRWHLDRGDQPGAKGYIRCKVCDEGELAPRKIFRLSGPAVAIGFILLVPSVLGMIFSALLFLGVTSTASAPAAVLGGGFSVALGVACFIGGLLGWLLVMQKWVLQCSTCGATTNTTSVPGAARWTPSGFLVSLAGCLAILISLIVLSKAAATKQSIGAVAPAREAVEVGGAMPAREAVADREAVAATNDIAPADRPPAPIAQSEEDMSDPSTERIEALRQRRAELTAQIRHDSALVDDVYRDQFRCPPSGTVGSPATCAGLEPMKYNLGGATQRVIFDLMGKVIGLRKETKYIDAAIANLKAGRPEDWAPPAAPSQPTSEAAGGGEVAPPTAPREITP